jgi:hypothetical protein
MGVTPGVGMLQPYMCMSAYYNVDTNTHEGYIFMVQEHYVHVQDGVVVQRWVIDGSIPNQWGHSIDLVTGARVDRYMYVGTSDRVGNLPGGLEVDLEVHRATGVVDMLYARTFATLPIEVQALLADFEYKDAIHRYSEKTRGRVVEYSPGL